MRLKLFPFTLKDKAKIWLNSLRPRSIRTWTNFQAEFLKKFFPTHRTNSLKRQISNFSAKESENPYAHIKEFEEVCNTFRVGGVSIDLMRLKLFSFTLKDKAKIWLNSLGA